MNYYHLTYNICNNKQCAESQTQNYETNNAILSVWKDHSGWRVQIFLRLKVEASRIASPRTFSIRWTRVRVRQVRKSYYSKHPIMNSNDSHLVRRLKMIAPLPKRWYRRKASLTIANRSVTATTWPSTIWTWRSASSVRNTKSAALVDITDRNCRRSVTCIRSAVWTVRRRERTMNLTPGICRGDRGSAVRDPSITEKVINRLFWLIITRPLIRERQLLKVRFMDYALEDVYV